MTDIKVTVPPIMWSEDDNAPEIETNIAVLDEGDIDHLIWIYNRLVEQHHENPRYDFIWHLAKIINKLRPNSL